MNILIYGQLFKGISIFYAVFSVIVFSNLAVGMTNESNPHSSSESQFKEKLARAMTGDPVAQHLVGNAYINGNGVVKDARKAFAWYETAAMQGNPDSEFNVGRAYEHGDGVEVNYKLALKWYTLAAEKGSVQAQNNLAHMYMDAKGTESDYSLALKLLKAAADKEHPTALNSLGYVYSKGIGVPKNDALSFEYYIRAADKGLDIAYFNVGSFYFHGDGGKQQDFHSAKTWYEKAAAQGVLRAFYYLGWMYGEAKLGKPNAILAYALTNVAASEKSERNFEIAQYREQLRKRMTQDQVKEAQILSNSLATPDTFDTAYRKYASGSRD